MKDLGTMCLYVVMHRKAFQSPGEIWLVKQKSLKGTAGGWVYFFRLTVDFLGVPGTRYL